MPITNPMLMMIVKSVRVRVAHGVFLFLHKVHTVCGVTGYKVSHRRRTLICVTSYWELQSNYYSGTTVATCW